MGRRLPRSIGCALAGSHQAGHGEEPVVRRPRLAAHAGGHCRRAQRRRAKADDRSRQIPRHRQDHARRLRPASLPRRHVGEVGRDVFFYYSGATPSAVRYKNWKMYYNMSQPGPEGWILPLVPFHFTLVQNIKRDPFEQAVGLSQKTAMSLGGALGGSVTAFQYDWNMLPIGQQLWMKELESFKTYPPMQTPATYNLDRILEE